MTHNCLECKHYDYVSPVPVEIEMIEIRYTDTDIAKMYSKRIRACQTKEALINLLKSDYSFLPDAINQAEKIDWQEWLWVKKNARSDEHAKKVIDLAGNLLMPDIMLKAAMISLQYSVPEGCALKRLIEEDTK